MFAVGLSSPITALTLQFVRYGLTPTESQLGNKVFLSDVYTALAVVFICMLLPPRLCS